MSVWYVNSHESLSRAVCSLLACLPLLHHRPALCPGARTLWAVGKGGSIDLKVYCTASSVHFSTPYFSAFHVSIPRSTNHLIHEILASLTLNVVSGFCSWGASIPEHTIAPHMVVLVSCFGRCAAAWVANESRSVLAFGYICVRLDFLYRKSLVKLPKPDM